MSTKKPYEFRARARMGAEAANKINDGNDETRKR